MWTYSGVRPLVDDGSGKPEAATRGYRFELDGGADGPESGGAPLLSVFGGKITTYRELSAEAVRQLAPFCPVLAGADWTGTAPLPGGDFGRFDAPGLAADFAERYPFLAEGEAARLARLYGTLAAGFLGDARRADDLGEAFGHALTAAEVDYLMDAEWARTAEDVLWRRTKLGLHFTPAQAARLARYMSERPAP